jgi:hypothetical protein
MTASARIHSKSKAKKTVTKRNVKGSKKDDNDYAAHQKETG